MPAPRGSTKMKAEGRVTISSAQMAQLSKLTTKHGIKLVDWTIYGQPAPEAISGAFQVKPGSVPNVIRDLLKLKGLRVRLDVFPYGIPNIDSVMVRFNSAIEPRGGIVVEG